MRTPPLSPIAALTISTRVSICGTVISEIITHRGVGLCHQLTHPLQVAFFEGAGGFHSAGILRQHVAYALRDDRIQLMGDGVKLLKGDIAQGGLLEEARAGFALFTTGVVLAADEYA